MDKDGQPYISVDYYFLGTSLSFDLYSNVGNNIIKVKSGRMVNMVDIIIALDSLSNLPFEIESIKPSHQFLCNKLKPREVR